MQQKQQQTKEDKGTVFQTTFTSAFILQCQDTMNEILHGQDLDLVTFFDIKL